MKSSRNTPAPASPRGVNSRRPPADFPDLSLMALLEQLLSGLRRLLVALHYQLLRLFPNRRHLPWFKIAIAILLVWMALKKDMQFQVNLKKPGAESSVFPGGASSNESGFLASQSSKPPRQNGFGLGLLGPRDPFADDPEDTGEDRRNKAYIRRFQEVAKTEMDKFGIPASIKMAQALIESQGGTSRLATKNNNHFGIKCFSRSCKKGHCANFTDDHHKDFFRIYSSAWESWRAHSYLITNGKYKKLLSHGKDYKDWARGLKELGYATDPRYEQKLLDYIDRYDLQTLDR